MSYKLLVWPQKAEPWFHSWYRGRVEPQGARLSTLYDYINNSTPPTVQRELKNIFFPLSTCMTLNFELMSFIGWEEEDVIIIIGPLHHDRGK